MTIHNRVIYIILEIITVLLFSSCTVISSNDNYKEFNTQRGYEDIKYQLELGPRIPGSVAHQDALKWMVSELQKANWDVETQQAEISGIKIKNVIAKRGQGNPWVIIGSHYDSREYADQDPTTQGRSLPVPGANDGASSVAILLEIARDIPKDPDKQIWLVFFDAEDISGDQIAVGSQYFVDELNGKPDSVIVLDMVGDSDLSINMEWNSDPVLNKEIWDVADELGYKQFIPAYKDAILDDHIPFLKAGIRAVDIIDFDYPYWHTTQDTLDKVSAESIKVVGDTILRWLELPSKNE